MLRPSAHAEEMDIAAGVIIIQNIRIGIDDFGREIFKLYQVACPR